MSAVVARFPAAALGQLALAVVLLGGSWPLTKIGLSGGAAPSWFAFGRAGLAGVVAAGLLGATGGLRWPARADVPSVVAIGLLQLAAFFAFAHAAIAWVPAGRTAVLANATLPWTVPIALVLTHEAIPPRRWLATALGAAGVVMLIGPWAIDWTSRDVLLGHAFLLAASLSWAIAMAVVRRWPPRSSLFQLLPWCFGLASLVLLPLALLHPAGPWSPTALGCLGFVGCVMAPLGTWCIVQATAALPLVVASVGFLAGPAVGLLLSAAFLGEPLTISLVLGSVLILAGAGMAAGSGR